MAQPLLAQLNAFEIARAQSLTLFANEERLSLYLRCSNSKDFSIVRATPHALTHPYIQPNNQIRFSRLVFDLDWHAEKSRFRKLPLRYLAERNTWENDLGLPAPNWVALSRDKNSAHIGYELVTPVARHENARMQPQRYLAAIEEAMLLRLDADKGFNGCLCKNPVNLAWDLYKGAEHPRDLHDLAEYVSLETSRENAYNRIPNGEVGRNVYLFDMVRFWAYDNFRAQEFKTFEKWEQAVIATVERINTARYDHLPIQDHGLLPYSECKSIGKSVASWVWKNHGRGAISREFRELQSWRGKRGATAAAKVKRERRELEIIEAIGQLTARGEIPTMGKVAALIGCSKPTLSKHYKHFFHGTLH